MNHKFPYKWNLKDGYKTKSNGLKVFGTFVCGGGSTMGYKLAGFNHLGGVEIDPKLADVYKTNHSPKYFYLQDIRKFNKREDLPKELYNLDILDGSPPCSSFSMAGSREKAWGKSKQFREGQAIQTLDDLVFEYVKTIKKLQPKVAILENVKGLIQGNAKAYAKRLKQEFENAGYKVQVFLLNAASMGVPQKRERVFFVGLRKDIKRPLLKLRFNERQITFKEIDKGLGDELSDSFKKWWERTQRGKSFSTAHPNGSYFNSHRLCNNKVVNTIMATGGAVLGHPNHPCKISDHSLKLAGTFPIDYNFKTVKPKYIIGMSVPPVMIAQIASKIKEQWFDYA